MDTNKTYQVVVTATEVNDLEAVAEALQELQKDYPGIRVEFYETTKLQ